MPTRPTYPVIVQSENLGPRELAFDVKSDSRVGSVHNKFMESGCPELWRLLLGCIIFTNGKPSLPISWDQDIAHKTIVLPPMVLLGEGMPDSRGSKPRPAPRRDSHLDGAFDD